jgi:hypothetical protein
LFVHYAIIIFTVSSKPLYKFYSTIDSTVRSNICNFHDSDVAEDDGIPNQKYCLCMCIIIDDKR